MKKQFNILVINPGSTTTKFSIYTNLEETFSHSIVHEPEDLNMYKQISDQQYYRRDLIEKTLKEYNLDQVNFDAVIGRGGLIRPVSSGTYMVNEVMRRDLRKALNGEHASNLGGLIAHEIAKKTKGCIALIADPVVVDEMTAKAKITGHPLFEKKSIFHALNQKAVARSFAKDTQQDYEKLNLIVCHMGGGITVGAHKKGKVVDVNNGYDGNGPFSPERAGTLPAGALIRLALDADFEKANLKQILTGGGGLMAHLGTSKFTDILEKLTQKEPKVQLIANAFVYNVGKEIGALAAALRGKTDAIILTGGIANSKWVIEKLKEMVGFLAPIHVYPGEDELRSLAENAYWVLKGEEKLKQY